MVTPEEFARVGALADHVLVALADEDWSAPAANLEWSCRQTLDHVIDCLFSFTLQLAARASSRFLPFNELHATAEASTADLLVGFRGAVRMFRDVTSNAEPGAVAGDGLALLTAEDGCARGAYEVALHSYDITTGLGAIWRLPDDLCRAITASEALWMFDRAAAATGDGPWASFLIGSGRRATG